MPTDNHEYNTPLRGASDWDIPLNQNFEQIDRDIEVRDTDADKATYDPRNGAKYFATDTEKVYLGDGAGWVELDTYGPTPTFDTVTTTGNVAVGGTVTIQGSETWHAGNDGPGTGLNADLLDGEEGAHYATQSAVNDIDDRLLSHVDDVANPHDVLLSELSDAESLDIDTEANLPTAGTANRLFVSSDGNAVYLDTGSEWVTVGEQATASTQVSTSDDGAEVLADTAGFNFGTELDVTDDGDGTVTIDAGAGLATTTDLANHEAVADAHHAKYTDTEAVAAVNAETSLDVDITGDAETVDGITGSSIPEIDVAENITGAWTFNGSAPATADDLAAHEGTSDAHHAKYTDAEAVSAVNAETSLDVDVTGDADTVDGVNVFVQDTEPAGWADGDLWFDPNP